MPEIIPFPGKKPEEPKKEDEEIERDGKILSWRKKDGGDDISRKTSSSGSDGKIKEYIPEKVSERPVKLEADEIDEIIDKIDADMETVGQKSANVDPKKAENFYVKPSVHKRTRQELIKSGRKQTRRFHEDLKSNESKKYDRVFER